MDFVLFCFVIVDWDFSFVLTSFNQLTASLYLQIIAKLTEQVLVIADGPCKAGKWEWSSNVCSVLPQVLLCVCGWLKATSFQTHILAPTQNNGR